ncbi:MAG: ADP-ribose pyrophosphatase [Candidatus Saccharibacteria bacterium]|nr:ADP-ribose pyrophosphatase [Candidatus Saccharibacteria bacterium]
MNILPTIRDSDLYEGVIDVDPNGFRTRTAARAIVLDDLNQVALLKVGNHNYYKLPGGGIEDGEDVKQALARELLEEIGCKAQVIGEVGEIVQYLGEKQLKQTSYCYLAKQIGEKAEPNFTDEELANGFEIRWAKNIDEAIVLLENSKTDDYSGTSIVKRDLTLLIAAKKLI